MKIRKIIFLILTVLFLYIITACSRVSTISGIPHVKEIPRAVADNQNAVPGEQQKDSTAEDKVQEIGGVEQEPDWAATGTETKREETLSSETYSFWYQLKDGRARTAEEIEKLLAKYNGIFAGPLQNILYLTFDLGYEAGYTAKILDILKEEDVKAAFFVTGDFVKKQPQLVKMMAAEGHIIGNHTETHPDLSSLAPEEITKELKGVDRRLAALGLPATTFFRPPRGVFNEMVLKTAGDNGYRAVLWSFAYRDWLTDEQPGLDTARTTILKGAFPGSVLLLHGVSRSNSEVLGDVIRELKNRGYTFGTLNEL
ncbi:polysaccharide deacetylase family protein [Moorella sulfitireducens]|uniref:polysaccharide deacetylase family protein n=1 Tax=Neomoorella sulfitireducens TaxID=2972948 RepID=UPI0021AC868C|nr:polysaccharide deacetylase family protein [Moorella sulfitireducens]